MKLKIEITMDNAAFENPGLEVANILGKLAHKAEYAGNDLDVSWRCALLDGNGNSVGEARIET